MKLFLRRFEVRPGDVLLSFHDATPLFRVESVHPARARGYLVFIGQSLVPTDGSGTQTSGHRTNSLLVERSEAHRRVCPNCGQWQHDYNGDCLNECKRRGFATEETR